MPTDTNGAPPEMSRSAADRVVQLPPDRPVGRRAFLASCGGALGSVLAPMATWAGSPARRTVRVFLCGDVMTGRGIDQILPHPSEPRLHEPGVTDARDYVRLAEELNGGIPRRVGFEYVWGDALGVLKRLAPDVRIVNLETSVTRSDRWLGKGINYRMHPENVGCLLRARIDCCVLANNHVLDYGREGLAETLGTLHRAGVHTAGAGRDGAEARAAAILPTKSGSRVLVVGIGCPSSGIPADWAAKPGEPGVNLLDEAPERAGDHLAAEIGHIRGASDVLVASIHWGSNWGFGIPESQRTLARLLVDRAHVDIVHGHSSHHVKGIEVYKGRPILYGCGDLLNDYEGIAGYEEYENDLGLMYFATVDSATGALESLRMTPMRRKRFRLEAAARHGTQWLQRTLERECSKLGTHVEIEPEGTLALRWT